MGYICDLEVRDDLRVPLTYFWSASLNSNTSFLKIILQITLKSSILQSLTSKSHQTFLKPPRMHNKTTLVPTNMTFYPKKLLFFEKLSIKKEEENIICIGWSHKIVGWLWKNLWNKQFPSTRYCIEQASKQKKERNFLVCLNCCCSNERRCNMK